MVGVLVIYHLYLFFRAKSIDKKLGKILSLPKEEQVKIFKDGGDKTLNDKEVKEYVRGQKQRKYSLVRLREFEARTRGSKDSLPTDGATQITKQHKPIQVNDAPKYGNDKPSTNTNTGKKREIIRFDF